MPFVRPVRWAGLSALAALGAALAAWALTPADPAALAQRFTPEHIAFILMIDSAPQRRAHLAAFLATTLACGLVAWLRMRGTQGSAWSAEAQLSWRSRVRWGLGPLSALGLWLVVDAPPATLVCSAIAAAVLAATALAPPAGRTVLAGLLAGYAAFLLLPGIFATPDLSQWPLLIPEWHYAYVISPGDRLAAGMELFTQVMPPYGVLLPTLLGGWERAYGLLSWGAHIQLVHVMDLLFVCAAAGAAVVWFRRLPGVLFTVLAVLPWLASFHPSTLMPNQSAWRFLGLPCAVLALLWVSRLRRERWGVALGLVTGALALFNPETAVASAAGFFVFVVLRLENVRALVRTCAELALTALGPVLVWLLAYRVLLGVFPFPSRLSAVFDVALRFSGGYGGFGFEKVSIAIVVLALAVYSVVVAFARKHPDRRAAIRAAIGTTIVVWFAYYANRGSASNLWTYLFLSSFLLDTWLHPRSLRLALRHGRRGQLSARSTCFALIFVVPALTVSERSIRGVLDQGFSPPAPPGEAEVISGVSLPGPVAQLLREKAAYLARTPDSFYLTTNGYTMPQLVGRFPDSPLGDAFAESMTPADTQRLSSWIRARGPARLLFDDPESPLTGSSPQQQYFERVRASFADQYEVEGTDSGWLVLRRR